MSNTILIVDDSEDDQRLYQRALRGHIEHTIKAALTAEAGLAISENITPALILLDYKLPDMDGLEFMKKLNPSIDAPVIMLTGEGSEPVAVEAMKVGASDYIVKDTAGGFLRLLPSVINRVLRSHAEKIANRKLRILHQTILHTVADGVIGVNADGSVLFANHSAERMLLATPNALAGRHITQLLWIDGSQSDWTVHPLATTFNHKASLCRDSDCLRRENGELFPVSYTASPLDLEDTTFSGWVMVFQDITERKKAEHELNRIAHFDTLTGLANRAMFHEYLEKAISRAERAGRQLALFFIDLDGFKEVNDKHGHHAGDELLQIAAKRLEECVRSGDIVSRLGGDEFTLIVEDSRYDSLESQAKKILDAIEVPYTLLGSLEARVSASIGIAFYPQCGEDAYLLIESADKAMYEVKKSGKNGYRIRNPEPA